MQKTWLSILLCLYCLLMSNISLSANASEFNNNYNISSNATNNQVVCYDSYTERNEYVSEKIVAIYDKRSPAFGYKYVLYSPIKGYVGHHKVMQSNGNGGFEPVPEGGEGSKVPCFNSLREAKHFYYPELY